MNDLFLSVRMLLRGCVFFVCVVCVLFGWAGFVSAMTVSPVLFDVQLNPGDSLERTMEIRNDSTQKVSYVLSSENFISEGEDGGQLYLNEKTKSDLASWISWKYDPIIVEPGQSVRIPVTIVIPQDATAGGHYATVFISQQRDTDTKDSIGMVQQIGVLFLVRVAGEITERALIDSFEVNGHSDFYSRLPIVFETRVRNQGSVHIRPSGYVVIRNAIGAIVATIPINETQGAILPNGIRKFENVWTKTDRSTRIASFWHEVIEELNQFTIGYYRAQALVTYGINTQEIRSVTKTFWIIPWHLLIVVFGALAIILLSLKLYKKWLICCLISESDAKRKTTRRRSS